MSCLSWILNAILGFFISLWLTGMWLGVYGLSDVPDWLGGGEYIDQIETVVAAPVAKVFPYGDHELKVIVEDSDDPVVISKSKIDNSSRAVQFALGYTAFVRYGLLLFGGIWLSGVGLRVVMAILRSIL